MHILLISVGFMLILVAPLPGGGRLSSQLFAEANQLNVFLMLGLVGVASLAEAYLLMVIPHRSTYLREKLDHAVRSRHVQRKLKRVPGLWRTTAVASLPFLPVGGGMLLACGAAHAWQLHPVKAALGIAAANLTAFAAYLLVAQTFGWLIIGLIVLGAVLISQRHRLPSLQLRPQI